MEDLPNAAGVLDETYFEGSALSIDQWTVRHMVMSTGANFASLSFPCFYSDRLVLASTDWESLLMRWTLKLANRSSSPSDFGDLSLRYPSTHVLLIVTTC